ncbi:MAG: GNAT family N-acetyltransferase [Cyanomargarita calcarea GSE-NOS-MK-12-04C]|jgi:ribosomal protein S18 acetylase RimI-like enzyme|uniref:GNAT family N-acetyltransferase n=1 Tax=Cyanomargarita calcarea GSE-NOS-MK-12-04C TaxID=2839659 RepID=A0A951V146_9CYAN|nr:GNAT family N-acetyltransferase [Cyanomargarita calcarea GSE-NOS-MK-12-04C]
MSNRIAIEDNPSAQDVRAVISNLVDFNETRVLKKDTYEPLAIFIRDANNEIVGGLVAETYWGWMFISHLWVKEALRGQGYGRKLMVLAEEEAKKRGYFNIFLDTFSFQAVGFYQKLGYEIFGTLEDFPQGHQRYFLQKRNLL